MIGRAGLVLAGLLAVGSMANGQTVAERLNDYPTAARADYVFGCMAANGQERDILLKCACSIDHIATILTYDQYVEAETVLSMQLTGGERMSIFRTAAMAKEIVANLRRAQAEAEILCFQQ
ncbi:hypothetical protein [Roseovarius aestuarii]|uniref:Uncharacterized protein n=1 Tax=Roseovarius aestuarii TaxID=475083 RepID=A0A1X7BXF2_9RHOB|nr:hypothetical protein [Roseovarius aestuarii]SMC13939.1 hypothetical protein ROA7745_03801 [Roseovarius aestuarii]